MAISYTISFTFSPNTTIASSQVNTNFSDNSNTWNGLEAKTKTISNLGIDTELKSGGTVKTADGTAGAPSLTFTAETTTGFYRSSAGVIGVGTGNKITGLTNGSAASDAAAFGQIPVFTSVAAYTPTVTGHGTVSGIAVEWRQMGDVIDVWGTYTAGTVAGSVWSMTLPVNINLTSIQNTQCILGILGIPDAGSTNGLLIFADGTTNNKVFLALPTGGVAGGGFVKRNGNSDANTGDTVSVRFSYPK